METVGTCTRRRYYYRHHCLLVLRLERRPTTMRSSSSSVLPVTPCNRNRPNILFTIFSSENVWPESSRYYYLILRITNLQCCGAGAHVRVHNTNAADNTVLSLINDVGRRPAVISSGASAAAGRKSETRRRRIPNTFGKTVIIIWLVTI